MASEENHEASERARRVRKERLKQIMDTPAFIKEMEEAVYVLNSFELGPDGETVLWNRYSDWHPKRRGRPVKFTNATHPQITVTIPRYDGGKRKARLTRARIKSFLCRVSDLDAPRFPRPKEVAHYSLPNVRAVERELEAALGRKPTPKDIERKLVELWERADRFENLTTVTARKGLLRRAGHEVPQAANRLGEPIGHIGAIKRQAKEAGIPRRHLAHLSGGTWSMRIGEETKTYSSGQKAIRARIEWDKANPGKRRRKRRTEE